MAAIQVRLKANPDRITSCQVKTVGTQGPACMLVTRAIQQLNPQAMIEYTGEFYHEEPQVNEDHLSLDE